MHVNLFLVPSKAVNLNYGITDTTIALSWTVSCDI